MNLSRRELLGYSLAVSGLVITESLQSISTAQATPAIAQKRPAGNTRINYEVNSLGESSGKLVGLVSVNDFSKPRVVISANVGMEIAFQDLGSVGIQAELLAVSLTNRNHILAASLKTGDDSEAKLALSTDGWNSKVIEDSPSAIQSGFLVYAVFTSDGKYCLVQSRAGRIAKVSFPSLDTDNLDYSGPNAFLSTVPRKQSDGTYLAFGTDQSFPESKYIKLVYNPQQHSIEAQYKTLAGNKEVSLYEPIGEVFDGRNHRVWFFGSENGKPVIVEINPAENKIAGVSNLDSKSTSNGVIIIGASIDEKTGRGILYPRFSNGTKNLLAFHGLNPSNAKSFPHNGWEDNDTHEFTGVVMVNGLAVIAEGREEVVYNKAVKKLNDKTPWAKTPLELQTS